MNQLPKNMTAVQIKGALIASAMDYGQAVADELSQKMRQSWLDDIKEKMAWLEENAYAEGRNDEAEEQTAIALIGAWVQTHGKPIPWESAVEITAVVNKLTDSERARLLALGEAA